ncbi:MAG: ATP-binding protein [Mariprofundaceae bacterium]|nr:ATP-binding protein [Mariprofundaceae bacterium]
MTLWIRSLPIVFAVLLCILTIGLWPTGHIQDVPILAWINIVLLLIISMTLSIYGIYLLRQISSPPGSRLRAKLVLGLVGMLLIPAGTLQLAANQMVERGMNTWFDMRVDTLLDRALKLAQGFYSRIDQDLQRTIQQYSQDTLLISDLAGLPHGYRHLNSRLNDIIHHEGWDNLQIYDRNERLIAALQLEGLATMQAEPWSQQARLSFTLGKVRSELVHHGEEEMMVAYAPIFIQNHVIALMKASVTLPSELIQHARAVESDYRTYRSLERNRQSIRKTFTQSMLFITLIVVIGVGFIAIIFSRHLTRPIGQLACALEQVTEGDFNAHIPQVPDDDLGALVTSFNRMALRMKQNIEALEHVQVDLTQALKSSQQRQYVLETLLSNLQNGVILINEEGEIRLINQSFRQLFGLSKPEWVAGKALAKIAAHSLPLIASFYSELHEQQHHGLQRELEWTMDGKVYHILARGERLKASEETGFSGYLLLFDDVTVLSDAQKNRAWAEVAQRLAHEIKNPLTPIKLAAERLQRRFRQQVEPTDIFDRCTGAIIGQTERLQRLVSDFSTLSRLPEPHCKAVACHTLLEEMRDLYSAYPRVKIDTLASNIYAHCDADQVRQVLINLMENALAATSEQQQTIHLYIKQEGQSIAFHLDDNGEGISDIHQAHLFDAYYSTKAEGSGLGLSIAKRIADEHGGDLLLMSPANPTHFCLHLPTHPEQTTLFSDTENI